MLLSRRPHGPSGARTRRPAPLRQRAGYSARQRLRAGALLVVAGLLVAVLGACSGSGGDGGSDSATDDEDSASASRSGIADGVPGGAASEPADGRQDALVDGGVQGTLPGSSSPLAVDLSQLPARDIIRTGSVALVVDDPSATRDRIVALVGTLGGYVSDEAASTLGSDVPRAEGLDEIRVVLQVPTGRFDDAVDRISSLGRVTSRAVQAQDVTGQVADVDSRVESARAALERIRALLDRANGLGTVIRLEGVLSKRQSDLEALLAQQSALAGQTQLATLEVTVTGKQPDRADPGDSDDAGGFVDGLRLGLDGLHDTYVAASTVAGAVLPFAVLVVLAGMPVLVWRRRRVSPQQAAPASGPQ